jgi:hypothetical protein
MNMLLITFFNYEINQFRFVKFFTPTITFKYLKCVIINKEVYSKSDKLQILSQNKL